MQRSARFTLAILMLAAAANAFAGNYLVVFKSGRVPDSAAASVAAAGGSVVGSLDDVGIMAVSGDERFAAALSADASVQAVGPEQLYFAPQENVFNPDSGPTAADTLYRYQWDMRRIGAPALWSR